MMRVLTYPDPGLTQCAADVDVATDGDVGRLAKTMLRVMHDAPGIGLAAPQIGVQKRVIAFDLEDDPHVLLNPKVVAHSDESSSFEEGCLSVPGIVVPVSRPDSILFEAFTLDGHEIRVEAEGLLARLIQHEVDHLDGVLMLDRATPEERKAALQRYREASL